MANSNVHVLSVPSLSPRALGVRAGLLLDAKQRVDVTGARNAFGLIETLTRRGVERLRIPGSDPEVFRYPEQIPENILNVLSAPLSVLHSVGVSSSIDVITLEPAVQEELSLPHMEQDVFTFDSRTLKYQSQRGWFVQRGADLGTDVGTFYGWIFIKREDLGFI